MRWSRVVSALSLLGVVQASQAVRRETVSTEAVEAKTKIMVNMPSINAVYYPNWKVYSSQPPSSMGLSHVTHIFYAFVWPGTDGTVQSTDQYADTQININGAKGCLGDLQRIKQKYPRIKTILSVGGYGTGSDRLAAVAKDAQQMKRFVTSLKQMVDTYHFDGVDSQPKQYLSMLQQLRQTFPINRYLLTSAMSAGTWVLQNIDIAAAVSMLDYLNLMAYDFSGSWTSKAGHQAQLFSPTNPYNDDAKLSCNSAIQYLISRGVPHAKILLGIPAYGRSFIGASKAGDSYSKVGGDGGTFDYRALPRSGSKVYYDQFLGATYAVGGDGGFVSFDDTRSVQAKAKYARQHSLGGVFFWTGTGDTNDARSLVQASYQALS